ncbi:MAG: class I SAM-dependent methyltransferase [Rhodocyclaceae bacterium]
MDWDAVWKHIAWLGKELRAKEIDAADVCSEVSYALLRLAAASPKQLNEGKNHIAKLLGIDNFDRWIEEVIKACDPATQYKITLFYSAACVLGSEYSTAMHIWSYAVTESRPPEAQFEAIDASAAPEYDSASVHLRACRSFMDFLRPSLEGKNDFIDLCCGTGLTTEHLQLADKRVVGIDLELDGLRANGRTSLFSALHQGDAQAILPSLPAASFDAIWCCGAAYFFSDLSWIFSEASRLLRPGGVLSMNVWPSPENMDVSITKGGTFRYCHSKGYLMRCAEAAGMCLAQTRWGLTYNMPTWYMIFEKHGG